ncbi:hypothetical protein GMD78_17975 [Ornithinibacillus sp. L9]|uniref:Uncharacterized protein n=1 Tax=Ornithinibacillus caprae TaxID=2678566 RepID=A0A6N8FLC1_9BACI|nr:hypothetical protein [Ornithinibacillus caprae]MUK90265.1 hypothetical protein [Ornithinibacillus caprae]
MTIIIWLVILIVNAYTIGFSITLWKGDSKVGAIAMFVVAVAIVITPFFSVLR